MSIRRFVLAGLVMAAVAAGLRLLAPELGSVIVALGHPQELVDRAGADALVVGVAGLLAWLAWAWGALGLLLTALAALPGGCGSTARVLLRVVLPAGARRAAALAIGIGLGVQGPLAGFAAAAPAPAAAPVWVPDWPVATATPVSVIPTAVVPDWPRDVPSQTTAAGHVVRPGDCLWDIAAARLRSSGRPTTDRDVAAEVRAWWTANAAVIGPDPDLLVPGQVLRPPVSP